MKVKKKKKEKPNKIVNQVRSGQETRGKIGNKPGMIYRCEKS